MRSSRVIVADLGATHVAVAGFRISPERELTLESIASAKVGLTDGADREWIKELSEALRLLRPANRGRKSVLLTIPGHLALVKWLKTQAIPRAQRARVVEFEAAQNIPYPLNEVIWAHQWVDGERGEDEIVLAAVKADAMAAICRATDNEGFIPRRATPAMATLYDAFRYSYPGAPPGSLILDLGARTTHVVLIDGQRSVGRTLPIGGNAITQTIATELGLPFEAAEALKIRPPSAAGARADDAVVERALQTFALKLQTEIVRTMVGLRRTPGSPAPTRVYLTGGTARHERMAALLSERLGLPTEQFSVLHRVHVEPRADAVARGHNVGLAQLVGLAAQELGSSAENLNLLPLRMKKAAAFRQRQPAILVAVALLLAALLPPVSFFKRAAKEEKREHLELERQVVSLRAAKAHSAARLAELERTNRLIDELQSLVDRKSSWTRFFADTQARLGSVEDVWLESLVILRDVEVPGATQGEAAHASSPLKLGLNGRLLDRSNPISKVSAESYERVKMLIARFAESPFVASVTQERFDNSQPGILRFDFTLTVGMNSTL